MHSWPRCSDCTAAKCPQPELSAWHVDGPYIAWCDGQMRWLTFRERVKMFFGKLDLRELKPR